MLMTIIRIALVAFGVIAQLFVWLWLLLFLGNEFIIFELVYMLIEVALVLAIIKNTHSISKDLPWLIVILIFPVAGALFYLIVRASLNRSPLIKKIDKSINESKKHLRENPSVVQQIKDRHLGDLYYLTKIVGFPAYQKNKISYYSLGDYVFPEMLKALKKAKKYIFIEYYIIGPDSTMWQEILAILEAKVKDGVDVRVMYDGWGSISMEHKYPPSRLRAKGIKCITFNKVSNILGSLVLNNRDHRKMMIIDGEIAFSGGINLDDNYINRSRPHGEWKDNGIKIEGKAAWSFTAQFLALWHVYSDEKEGYVNFQPNTDFAATFKPNGLTAPYSTSPFEKEYVGENIYLNIINSAKEYVYMYTPYLILDESMIIALELAAKRGVDVRIIVPNDPDWKIIFDVTCSYFERLIKSDVKIYRYLPGFIHSKVFISDDTIATVGSINMDYRSLYHHFECGVYLYKVSALGDIKKDLLEACNKSHSVSLKEATPTLPRSIYQAILRFFAPML
ncbi:cardiolipin synthase [Candidatus Saccharibacteria bacterium]|nr:cardiolipin synthase [Candidatus Saccharibacteria bacterium]